MKLHIKTLQTSDAIAKHMSHEFCSNHRGKYTLDSVCSYISTCTTHIIVSLPHVRFHVIYPKDTMELNITQLHMVCRRIDALLHIHDFQGELEYFMVPIDYPRLFPTSGPVKPSHINGAYTYVHSNAIYIYRQEEYPKVALHEACHHLKYDTRSWSRSSIAKLKSAFQIDASVTLLPNEAVIEAWANIYHFKIYYRKRLNTV
jgi:hypothetical protein